MEEIEFNPLLKRTASSPKRFRRSLRLLFEQGGVRLIELSDMPAINAALNATSAALLLAGYACIRRGRVAAHLACMSGAFFVSTVFLACYVTYHVGRQRLTGSAHVEFQGEGAIRFVYFTILGSHILLAIAVLPLALRTLYLAARRRIDQHRRIARWTLPIWLYVSVTGVIVYWMLYHLTSSN